jgi:hypothetical protein
VRRLTRSPSASQLTDANIDEYINNFILYDFPEHLRLFSLKQTLSFFTDPYIDTYYTNTTNANDPLYNFENKVVNVSSPVYIAGKEVAFFQSFELFHRSYPKNQSIQDTGNTGDEATHSYSGTLSSCPVLQNDVAFTSVDADSVGIKLIDVPRDSGVIGDLFAPNEDPTGVSRGEINYATGAYWFCFISAPASGEVIYSHTVPYSSATPISALYYDNQITLRPVPDKSYEVELTVDVRPTELLDQANTPELGQWWQYIAYGASKKVFEDRMDTESIQQIMPEFKEQQRLALRRTIVQNSNNRTATIYAGLPYYGVNDDPS